MCLTNFFLRDENSVWLFSSAQLPSHARQSLSRGFFALREEIGNQFDIDLASFSTNCGS